MRNARRWWMVLGLAGFMLTVVARPATAQHAGAVTLTFWYPVDVGGGLAKVVDGMVRDFNSEHPDIQVTPVYSGSYDVTLQKLQAGTLAGTMPDVAVTELSALTVLAALGAAQPLDELVAAEGGRTFLDRFWPSMLTNTVYGGKTYGIPFQRSTPVMYYNKEAFREVGLDPEKPPVTWDDLARAA
jgi:sn-glycerol 3-phosphate transport system substrate-binding protein